ncbi:hypothetical protein SAMN05216410_0005 [Sanguibacter gelidistatuariae]|uniref:Uncharacterized protein n=1 Tax=Sanguibacter gelidistatuariae TaxID=1814289 RepID=A0A1G6WTY0_9MICO|nr:hypothetical protein [Sanguibacter gelidistatuariae]SDD69332.1 hypothetical protein SAMN05216410_0005 [Sanguibacter gelidistatuariae]
MAAVADALWAPGRTESEFGEFLAEMPGVSLVDGYYVSDHALARGRTTPVVVVGPAAQGLPGERGLAEEGLPATLTTVTTAAGLSLVSGPVTVATAAAGQMRFWIFHDPRPVIGARYLVTLVGNAASITPDLIAQVIRLTEDNCADRAIMVAQRAIAAAADAYAKGKPVLLVPAAEVARVGREVRRG